jgi:hypothetical protein
MIIFDIILAILRARHQSKLWASPLSCELQASGPELINPIF